jgi:hypothetical protein
MRKLQFVRNALLLAAVGVAATGCGSGDSSSASSNTSSMSHAVSLSQAVTSMQQNLTTQSPHIVNSSTVTAFNWHRMMRNVGGLFIPDALAADFGLSTIWDPNSGQAPTGSEFGLENLYIGGGFTCDASNNCTNGTVSVPGVESLTNYMGQALDPNFENSNGASITIFGRMKNAQMVLCIMGQVLPAASTDTDGLPVVGAVTLAFPADTSSTVYQAISSGGCGVPSSFVGISLPMTVTAVSSTNYTKQISLTVQNPIIMWLKLDASAGIFNFMSVEDQRPSGRYAADRAIVNITGIGTSGSETVRYEYVGIGSASSASTSCYANGGWNCDYEFHRVFIDQTANTAYLLSNDGSPADQSGGTGAPTQYVQYTGTGAPSSLSSCSAGATCTATLALSFTAAGQSGATGVYPSVGNEYDGCVNAASRELSNDGSLACDVPGVPMLASGGASATIELTREVYIGDVMATLLANTTAATTLAFTNGSDMYTAPNTQ